MTREKMHKEMVLPGGFFLRRVAEQTVGIGENCVENLRKTLEEITCHYVKSDKNRREKLAKDS